VTDEKKLIYDWNSVDCSTRAADKPVLLNDETLRDGLQSPTVQDPSIKDKIRILHLMDELGIDYSIIYPTRLLTGNSIPQDETRRAVCRAYNRMVADIYAPTNHA